jgi:hypothetical protein
MSTALDEKIDTREDVSTTDAGDHDLFSHYVKKDEILQSAFDGVPARAICGKKWFPGRDPQKFPVCPECKDIYETMKDE